MGHHFSFFQKGYSPDLPEKERLRLFIRKHRKAILVVLALGIVLVLFLAVLAGLLLFKVIVPALLGTADSPAAQNGFVVIKNWLTQLAGTNPLQWLNLLLQAGS